MLAHNDLALVKAKKTPPNQMLLSRMLVILCSCCAIARSDAQATDGTTAAVRATVDDVGRVSVRSDNGSADLVRIALPGTIRADEKAIVTTGTGMATSTKWTAIGEGLARKWYILVNDGTRTRGWGVKVQPKAICTWKVSPAKGVELILDVRAGNNPLELGKRTLDAATVVTAEGGDWFEVGLELCRRMCPHPRLPREPLYGFNDWYAAYGSNTATNFLADAAFIVSLCKGNRYRPYVVMDDGWQEFSPPKIQKLTGSFVSGYGPWERSSESFGMEMREFCSKIAELGAKPGLWYRPLNMRGKFEDPSDPRVVARIQADIRRFREWGFKFVKCDYLTYDIYRTWKNSDAENVYITDRVRIADRTRTTAETVLALYRAMREAAGDAMVILGCNSENHLAAGLFETCRVGADTSGKKWETTKRNGVSCVAYKGFENGTLYAADPDCAGLAEAGAIPWENNSQWIDLLSRSGMPCFVSWRRTLADNAVRAKLTEAFKRASDTRQCAVPLDSFANPIPRCWRTCTGEVTYFTAP